MNLTFECGLVSVIDKPTRATKSIATAIGHIITNSLLYRSIDAGIIKLDISDHFSIFMIAGTEKRMTQEEKVQITKRLIRSETKKKFKNAIQETTWNDIISS